MSTIATNTPEMSVPTKPNFQRMHEEKLQAMKAKILGSDIFQKLELKTLSNNNIDNIIRKMNAILSPKQVWDDFNFRTGRIFGILRSIAQAPDMRKQLFEVTGLNQTHIDLYKEVCGRLPFIRKDGTLDIGYPMKVEECKQLITLVSTIFNYVVEEEDMFDITEERWTHLYDNAMERCNVNLKENAEQEKVIYDE